MMKAHVRCATEAVRHGSICIVLYADAMMAKPPHVTTQDFALVATATAIVSSQIYGYGEVDKYAEAAGNVTASDYNMVWLKGT